MNISLFFILVATPNQPVQEPTHETAWPLVHHAGMLRNIMHKGDTAAKIRLASLPIGADYYALGALEKLDGEILILGGETYLTRARGKQAFIEEDMDQGAALLVYAQVEAWRELSIAEPMADIKALEARIGKEAMRLGWDSKEAFPFLIKGEAAEAAWHVVTEPEPNAPRTHESHRKAGLNGSFSKKQVEILGFYSTSHQGVFTHFDSRAHMHVRPLGERFAGHLDAIRLEAGFTLSLPGASGN